MTTSAPARAAALGDSAVTLAVLGRADFDPALLYDDLTGIVAALTANGADVLAARYHHHGRVFPLPGVLARALNARIDALNTVIDRVVREQRVHCLDLAALPACCEASTWSIDRLHPSARGHRLLARAFVDLLHTAGHPDQPSGPRRRGGRPAAEPCRSGRVASQGTLAVVVATVS